MYDIYGTAIPVTINVSGGASVPGAPTGASATAGNAQATITFTAPASNGGAAIISYKATANPGGANSTCVGPTACSITVTGLSNGTAYTFTVTATNSVGTGSASAASNSVTPKASQTITFNNPGSQNFGTSPTLTASATSGLSPTFTSSTTGVCTITSGGALTFVTAGTCTINADQSGNGSYLAATTVSQSFSVNAVVPGAPTIGTATAGDTQASVTFSAPASNGGATITGYTVTASPGGATASGAASPITVTGLSNGTAYTFTVTATNPAGAGSASAASNSVTPKANQTITFANPGTQNFGTSPTLSATSTSGLSVTFTSSTSSVCTITSGGALTLVTAGTCTINADQAGNGSYLAAAQVSRSFSVNAVVPGAPTIGTATAGNTQASITFSVPASNGGATITGYTVTASPGGATASGAASPITVTGLSNGTAYTFTVTATNPAGTGSASAASNSVTPKASQTITFNNPGSRNFGTSPTLTASATSGLSPTFTSSTTGVCTITSGGALTLVTAGTCTINADQAGNGSYLAAATVSQSFSVNAVVPGAPTIGTATAGDTQASVTFSAPASNGGATITGYTVTASPGGATASGAASPITVTGLSNGTTYTFTVTATNSAGTGSASAASNSVTPKANQTITFANPGAQNFGTSPTLSATSTSGLSVTFTSSTSSVCTITSGGALTLVTAGTCTINADQAGNGSYLAATTVSQSFSVNAVVPGAPTIGTATAGDTQASVTFSAPASNGGATITGYTVTASPGGATGTGSASPLTVTGLSNGTAYTFTVTATNPAGAGSASAASNSVTPKASQTITFNYPAAQNFGTSPTLSATSTSGLSVTFTSSTSSVCTITSGGALTLVTAGTCTINADQAGNGSYLAAAQVSRSFSVNAVVPGAPTGASATAGASQATVTFSAPASNGGAGISGYTVIANPGGATASGASSPLTVTGLTNGTAYTFTVSATNPAGNGSASAASNSVTPKAGQTITFSNPASQNFGASPTLTASATSGLSVTFTSSTTGVCTITSGGALTFVTTGTCTVNADQAGNGSYLAAATVSRSFAVNAVATGAPTIGTATAGDAQATVTFSAPASNGGAGITGYTVIASPGGATASGAASPLTVTGLTNGTAYTFTVTATNSAGTGSASAASNSVTPKAGQTITFNNPASQNFGTSPTLTASATSGLSPTFTSSTTGVCTITSGGALSFVTAGTCTINADQAGNGSYLAATTVTRSFAVNAPTLALTPAAGTALSGTAGSGYSQSFSASGGTAPYTFSALTINSGSLPGGLSFSTSSGTLSGTATAAGTVNFTVKATDSSGGSPFIVTGSYTLTVAAPGIGVSPGTLSAPAIGTAYSQTATASGGTAPYAYAVSSGALPAGLGLNSSSGAITGTPTAGGNFSFTIRATDTYGFTGSRAYSVTVAAPGIALSPATLSGGQVGAAYSQTLGVSGGTAPYTYSIVSGALPSGLSLTGSTGAISGTPTAAGTHSFTIKAADSSTGTGAPYSATQAYSITVAQQAPVASGRVVTVAHNTPTAIDLASSISGGAPASVALTTVPGHGTAQVSGLTVTYTPAAGYSGTDSFTYTVANAGGSSGPALVSIAVSAPPPAVSSINPASGSSAGGTVVTLNGSNFQNATAVNFGGVSASFSIVSGTAIAVTAPAGNAGKVNITVTSPAGTSTAGAGNQYTYLPVGTLVFATPNAASVAMTGSLTNVATSTLSGGSYGAITYSSSNTAVAAVDNNGVVTPVSVGSSTITASQAAVSGVNAASSQSYLLTVVRNSQAPLHLSSDKSAIYKNSGTAILQTTGGSGTGALGYALTSGNCSLTGNILTAGNATGSCVVTVTKAADANFSAATASITIVVQNLLTSNIALTSSNLRPVQGQSITLTAAVSPDTATGTVSFLDGDAVLGSGILKAGVATYKTDALTVASHSLRAKYAGDAMTAPASSEVLTVAVASRPVPAAAAAVKGQVESHTATTHRFAMAQMNNIYSHVQLLHNDFKVRNNFGIGLNAPHLDVLRLVGNKIAGNYDGLSAGILPGSQWHMGSTHNAEFRRMASAPFVRDGDEHGRTAAARADNDADPDTAAGKPDTAPMHIAGMPVGIWGAGNIDYGSLNALDGSGNKFSSSGLTLGMDMMAHPKLIVGASIGYAKDTTTLDLLGSESKSRQWSASLYASCKPEKNWFVDIVAGHGRLTFDNRRWSDIDSKLLSGDRSGTVDYASFSLTRDMPAGRTRFQPFGRFDILNAKMDSYTEQGGNFGLTYNESSFTNTAFTGGLTLSKDVYYAFGQVTPSLKVQVTRRTSGSVNQSMYYADLGPDSLNYNVVVSGTPENMQAVGLGLNVKTRSGLMLNLGWLGSLGSDSYHANSFRLDMRFGF